MVLLEIAWCLLCRLHTLCITLRENYRHAVELAFDAIETFGDADWVMENCGLSVVRVRFVVRLQLVKGENIVDQFLFLRCCLASREVPYFRRGGTVGV